MFQLETTNIKFEHLVICCKGCRGQKSPKVIQGHLGSLRVKNKIIAIPHNILLNYNKTCSMVMFAYNQEKSSDHIIFYISGFHGFLFLA